jgi:hypothetical protein
VDPADVVVLHRIVRCCPDFRGLLAAVAGHAGRRVDPGPVHPRHRVAAAAIQADLDGDQVGLSQLGRPVPGHQKDQAGLRPVITGRPPHQGLSDLERTEAGGQWLRHHGASPSGHDTGGRRPTAADN